MSTRRSLLKKSGAVGIGASVGLGGLITMTDGAAAAKNSFDAKSAEVTTDDGTVSRVFVVPSGSVKWQNFDEPVQYISITISSRVLNSSDKAITGWTQALDKQWDIGQHASTDGEFNNQQLGEIDLYGGDSGNDVSLFAEADDGGSLQRKVQLKITVTLLNSSQTACDPSDTAVMEDTVIFSTTTTNAEASSSASGTMDGGIE